MARLAALDLVTPEDEVRVQHLWWFGRLIGNTDMHTGNLSFRPEQGRFALAPLYDMLPMRYAPLAGGEVPARELSPVLPLPPQRAVWLVACAAAIAFWQAAAAIGASARTSMPSVPEMPMTWCGCASGCERNVPLTLKKAVKALG